MPRCPGPGSPGGLSRARLGSCRTPSRPRGTRWHCGVPRPRLRRGCGSSWGHGAMGDGSITGRCGGPGVKGDRQPQSPDPSKATGTLGGPGVQAPAPHCQAGHTPGRSRGRRRCTHPHPCHAASTCLLPCPWPCSQPPPLLRPTLPLGQRAGVPETAESPRELLAHFARPRQMQLKLAEDRQVDGPPAPCPPGPSLAPHPRPPTLSLARGGGGRWGGGAEM